RRALARLPRPRALPRLLPHLPGPAGEDGPGQRPRASRGWPALPPRGARARVTLGAARLLSRSVAEEEAEEAAPARPRVSRARRLSARAGRAPADRHRSLRLWRDAFPPSGRRRCAGASRVELSPAAASHPLRDQVSRGGTTDLDAPLEEAESTADTVRRIRVHLYMGHRRSYLSSPPPPW